MYQTFFQLFYFSNFVFGCGLLYVVHVFREVPQSIKDDLVDANQVDKSDVFNQVSDLNNREEGFNRA